MQPNAQTAVPFIDRHPRLVKTLGARNLAQVLAFNVAPALALAALVLWRGPFSWSTAIGGLSLGLLYWSFFEYAMHRWLYHGKWYPKRWRPIAESFHHHHHHHMADTRVLNAGPGMSYPALAILLAPVAILSGGHWAFVAWVSVGLTSYYGFYETVHRAIHYKLWHRGYLHRLQKVHLFHHDRRWNRNFGNTTTLWDRLLGTHDIGWQGYAVPAATQTTFITRQRRPVAPDAVTLTAIQRSAKPFTVAALDKRRHNLRNLSWLAALLLASIGAVWLAAGLGPWAWVFAPLAFGWLLFATITLVVHEASHEMFLLFDDKRKTQRWNRFFGRLVCLPIGVDYTNEWQTGHRKHHKHPVTPDDPQNCQAPVGRQLFKTILLALVPGWLLLRSIRLRSTAAVFGCRPGENPTWRLRQSLLQAALLLTLSTGLAVWGRWPLGAYLFVGFQVAAILNLIKVALEHGGPSLQQQTDRRLRSRSSNGWLARLVFPFNIALHFEHHLNAKVPWYRLRAFHKALATRLAPEQRAWIHNQNAAFDQLAGWR